MNSDTGFSDTNSESDTGIRELLSKVSVGTVAVLLLVSIAVVSVTAQPSNQQEGPENTITIESTSDERAFYNVTVSSTIEPGEEADLVSENTGTDFPDSVSDNSASGSIAEGGADDFVFTGEITTLSVDGPATVYVNGEEIDSDEITDEPPTTITTTRTTMTTTPTTTTRTLPPTTTVARKTPLSTTTARKTPPPTTTTRTVPSTTTRRPPSATTTQTPTSPFMITGLSANDETVGVNETVEIAATVENTGSTQRTAEIALTTFGEEVDSTELTLGPGEVRDISFEHSYDSPGTYTASAGDQQVRIQVEIETDGGTETPDSRSGSEGFANGGIVGAITEAASGFVIVILVTAVIGLTIVAVMRL